MSLTVRVRSQTLLANLGSTSSPRPLGCLSHFTRSASRHDSSSDRSVSAKLFEDAAREEAEEQAAASQRENKNPLLTDPSENWTGEESMQDAVLRMLVDKYKPLRSGPIKSADEKLKQAPPKVALPSTPHIPSSEVKVEEAASKPSTSTSFLPGKEGHKPWHTTFTVPSHATASVKLGTYPVRSSKPAAPGDEKAQKKERETKKRVMEATRLTRAREDTLDYRLGIKGGQATRSARPNPISVKGWTSLVEERIERARLEGHFRNISGRGKPIERKSDEGNPFIAREEYLMNRIVKRQGAAPPWIEIQCELESAVSSFREILRQSWTRRAVRLLTVSPSSTLPSLSTVSSLRDPLWEGLEHNYHETAVGEINSLVRKYNAVAPYSVRRAYYSRQVELERCYEQSGEDIVRGIEARLKEQQSGLSTPVGVGDEDDGPGARVGVPADSGNAFGMFRLRDVIRNLFSSGGR